MKNLEQSQDRNYRRDFLKLMAFGAASLAMPSFNSIAKPNPTMRLGLVTYQWGRDWDLPTLIRNCEKSNLLGVELRTQHKHGVEPSLNARQRNEVKKQFENSPVVVLGYGSNDEYHSPEPAVLHKNMENTRALLHLSHDIGGSGVKVKPNTFPKEVPQEKTLDQIGQSLRTLGKYAADLGQEIRLEVHGKGTQELPHIKTIMDVADHPKVRVCWNSNNEDLNGGGLVHNFNLVKDRLGDTVHVRELNDESYPYADLLKLLVEADYKGWLLLECSTEPADRVAAMAEQSRLFEKMLADAQK